MTQSAPWQHPGYFPSTLKEHALYRVLYFLIHLPCMRGAFQWNIVDLSRGKILSVSHLRVGDKLINDAFIINRIVYKE